VIGTQPKSSAAGFYVIGGTLRRDAPSYVERDADGRILASLKQGDFCYVLTARQMGKSSLMVRTASRLKSERFHVAVLDLTALGQNLTIDQWYFGLLGRIGEQFDLEGELEEVWLRYSQLGPLQRWMRAVVEVLLSTCAGSIVIFIDEIDAVRSLAFSTDEFFAGIRELYNRRAQEPELRRLSFCLLGVATPSDLIRDTRTTPFNIGHRIELSDFNESEAAPLALGVSRNGNDGSALLRRVLYWTGGHPYLTQRLCCAVAQDETALSVSAVDRICRDLFLTVRAREHDDNLHFVRERLLRSEVDTPSLLTLYAKIRRGKKVRNDETDRLIGVLRLAGITRSEKGFLRLRNRIYESVFDPDWILCNMPGSELRRQRAAYKRGLRVAGLAAIPLVLGATAMVVNLYSHATAPPETSKPLTPPPFWASFSASTAAQMNSGSLLVKTGEPDVSIFLDEQLYGRTGNEGSLQIDRLQSGPHTVRAQKPGFQEISLLAYIKPQLIVPMNLKLFHRTEALALGSLLVQGAPSGAAVSLDGREVGITSESGSFLLNAAPGTHTIRIAKEGYLTSQINQDFNLGVKTSMDVPLQPDVEMQRWKALSGKDDATALREYVRDYPNGRFSQQARDRADLLEWNTLKDRNDADAVRALSAFVDLCRNRTYCDQALARMTTLAAEDEAWVAASRAGDPGQYQNYLAAYPHGRYSEVARAQLLQMDKLDDAQIREVLQKFQAAFDHRDMSGILEVWPSYPATTQKATRELFRDLKSFSTSLTIASVDRQGGVATVSCQRTLDWMGVDGGRGRKQDQVTYRLAKQNGHWLIDSIVH